MKFTVLDENGMKIPDADATHLAATCAVTVSFTGGDPAPNCAAYDAAEDQFSLLLQIPATLPAGTYFVDVSVQTSALTLGTGSFQLSVRNPPM